MENEDRTTGGCFLFGEFRCGSQRSEYYELCQGASFIYLYYTAGSIVASERMEIERIAFVHSRRESRCRMADRFTVDTDEPSFTVRRKDVQEALLHL